MIRLAVYFRDSQELDPISEARASDLRSHPGPWWNRIKLRLCEGEESWVISEDLLNWQTCGGQSVSSRNTLT